MRRGIDWKRLPAGVLGLALALGLAGCVSIGHEFPVAKADELKIGVTTQQDVKRTFGNPLMIGVSDGNPSWTYTRVRYSPFRGARAEYLEVEFDEKGVLSSYSVNTTR